MFKRKRRELLADFSPKAPNAKVVTPHFGVVKQNDGPVAELAAPAFKVVPDRFVRVQAIDVQQIDAAVRNVAERFIERLLQKCGEMPVPRIVVLPQLFQNLLAVMACVRVTLPSVNAPSPHLYGESFRRLAKREIRDMPRYTMIFRTNVALLTTAEDLIAQGKKIKAEVNIADFIRQLKSVINLRQGKKPYHDSISRFTDWKDLLDFAQESVEIKRLIDISLRPDVEKFIQRLESIEECTNPDIILTTAHKSKGLEFDNVVVANDFKFGSKNVLDMPEQEINLLYVACTRAKLNLQIPDALLDLLEERNEV